MATHFAASMRVVASIQHRRRVTVADAREAVLEAAQRVEDGIAGPETLLLVERLERVTWRRHRRARAPREGLELGRATIAALGHGGPVCGARRRTLPR